MKKFFLVLPVIMMLSACGTPSVEDFMEDTELLGKTIGKCSLLMAQGKDAATEECQNATEAQKQMASNLMNGMMKKLGVQ